MPMANRPNCAACRWARPPTIAMISTKPMQAMRIFSRTDISGSPPGPKRQASPTYLTLTVIFMLGWMLQRTLKRPALSNL